MAIHSTTIAAVAVSRQKGTPKDPVASARLLRDHGLEGDAHAGPGDRQVSILALPGIRVMEARFGSRLGFGRFGENLVLTDELPAFQRGDLLAIGDRIVLEVTAIGKECHHGCAIRQQTGDCIMPREGVFARVVAGGTVTAGDPVRTLRPRDDLAIAVLAGGRSERFGSDKREAMLRGRTLLSRALECARRASPNVLLSLAADDPVAVPDGVLAVHDDRADAGPLAGVIACLRAATRRYVAFIPVDMPMVPSDLLKSMAVRCTGSGIAFCQGDRRLPLPACYDRAALEPIEAAFADGARSLRDGADRAGVAFVDVTAFQDTGAPSCWLRNVNTPADLDALPIDDEAPLTR